VEETRVESWIELQELLYGDSWHEELRRHRSDFCFRGENDARNELTTSLQRLGGDYASLEQHLLRSFRKYAPRREVPVDSTWASVERAAARTRTTTRSPGRSCAASITVGTFPCQSR
jgi:hypothetical protein